ADLRHLVLLANHNTDRLLATVKGKTLRVEADARGLHFEADIPAAERGLVELVARGDLTGASFAFRVPPDGDTWDMKTTPPTRTIRGMEIREISAGIVWPAYSQTHVAALRSLERAKEPMMAETQTPPIVTAESVPPVPPVVTERAVHDDTE